MNPIGPHVTHQQMLVGPVEDGEQKNVADRTRPAT
jgi:hypothetical protein